VAASFLPPLLISYSLIEKATLETRKVIPVNAVYATRTENGKEMNVWRVASVDVAAKTSSSLISICRGNSGPCLTDRLSRHKLIRNRSYAFLVVLECVQARRRK
jgi:hypothetical protein